VTGQGDRTFDCWTVSIGPGEERAVAAGEWADTMVLVESGELDVRCEAGASRTFHAGDLLALSWLRARNLVNHGAERVKLVAVRRSVR
jgi:glyoxylate utilization-related uncharacterized protein